MKSQSRGAWFLLLCALASPAAAEEIVENYPDGKVKARYDVDAEGRKNGDYEELHPDGQKAVRGKYKQGERNGSWSEWDAAGELIVKCSYSAGRLNGKYVRNHPSGKPNITTAYKDGVPVAPVMVSDEKGRVLRMIEYPAPLAELNARIKQLAGGPELPVRFTTEPSVKAPYLAGVVDPAAEKQGLGMLQLCRYLCGLRWDDLELESRQTEACQQGAVLMAATGSALDSEPKQPADMERKFYDPARSACSESLKLREVTGGFRNLVRELLLSVTGGGDQTLRSRRQMLSPGMRRTAFGVCEGTFLTHSFDRNGKVTTRGDTFCYPSAGFFPIELTKPGMAWSVSFEKHTPAATANLVVTMSRLGDDYLEVESVEVGDTYFAEAAFTRIIAAGKESNVAGMAATLVFVPRIETYAPARYWVQVSGLDEKNWPQGNFGYVVDLVETPLAQALPGKQ